MLTRIAACQWFLYAIQWAFVVSQCWAFVWTIKSDSLGVSLFQILFGSDYLRQFKDGICNFNFRCPRGGIYFVFFVILIAFFVLRNHYRLKQMEKTNDAAHKWATNFSMYLIVVPLCYISVIAFAHTIYPYIPYDKGGGDYSRNSPVHITFNVSAISQKGFQVVVPQEILDLNYSNRLTVLDENGSFVYLADTNSGHGPLKWRSGDGKPTVYEVGREAITVISQEDSGSISIK